jgi:hypothetical protein
MAALQTQQPRTLTADCSRVLLLAYISSLLILFVDAMPSLVSFLPLLGGLAAAQQFVPQPQNLELVTSELFEGAEISYKKAGLVFEVWCERVVSNSRTDKHL